MCSAYDLLLSSLCQITALLMALVALQSISDKLRLKDNNKMNPPEAVKHVTEAVKQLGISEGREE